ncbi:hypothetical protein SAMN05192583_2793 [Sphingomonas gellani]|uniref:Phytase-like domain-containing protein n=1 Tax=Sphingomonas gellani TaxID=1166340 RepID=A0A1H8GKB4_9SPHN|nr:esterase-like activity of phytase family protein [Sphingomonas gellani]SEN44259.1 hypothetical protein SAMN05192583_2793 [Sphingomonas gellani]
MRRPATIAFVWLAVLAVVPGWTGDARLAELGRTAHLSAAPVALDPRDPSRRRLRALTYLDGLVLTSPDSAFGGYSAIHVSVTSARRRVTLLSDGGNVAAFTLDARGQPRDPAFANLPSGPGIGWDKADRDSESLATDPATGRLWVGFENHNAIMRYAPGFTRGERLVRPAAMRKWPKAGGAESLVRRADGSFFAISEMRRPSRRVWPGPGRGQAREGLIWSGDPVEPTTPQPTRFTYVTVGRYDVADAAMLPDGRMLVLERAFDWPYRFHNRIVLIAAGAVRPGAVVRGRLLAELDAPLIHDNFEGIATTREGGSTVIWLVSDDNRTPFLQRTLLLRFRLDG